MRSSSEEGSYLRLVDFLSLKSRPRVIKKKKKLPCRRRCRAAWGPCFSPGLGSHRLPTNRSIEFFCNCGKSTGFYGRKTPPISFRHGTFKVMTKRFRCFFLAGSGSRRLPPIRSVSLQSYPPLATPCPDSQGASKSFDFRGHVPASRG